MSQFTLCSSHRNQMAVLPLLVERYVCGHEIIIWYLSRSVLSEFESEYGVWLSGGGFWMKATAEVAWMLLCSGDYKCDVVHSNLSPNAIRGRTNCVHTIERAVLLCRLPFTSLVLALSTGKRIHILYIHSSILYLVIAPQRNIYCILFR